MNVHGALSDPPAERNADPTGIDVVDDSPPDPFRYCTVIGPG